MWSISKNAILARFGGPLGRNAFWETAKNDRRPLDETLYRTIRVSQPFIPIFPLGAPKRLFWAPGVLEPIQKRQFCRHAKTVAENGPNPIRVLKCQVRQENSDDHLLICDVGDNDDCEDRTIVLLGRICQSYKL